MGVDLSATRVRAGEPALGSGVRHDNGNGRLDPVTGWGYRPQLDGLRAVAVTLVVAFHASIARAAGGFVGVDVFFVLSGYLVTRILLRDVGETGRVSLARFYSRRMRRLLPAAGVNLVATAVVFTVIAVPAELDAARRGIAAAALYVSNWYFIAESADYFGTDVAAHPVVHYWSLSIEEQFYLLWPLLLGGLLVVARRLGHRRTAAMRGVVAVAAMASLLAAIAMATKDLDRAYYGTDTRAYQLLAGALIALTPGVIVRVARHRARRSLAAVASLGLLAVLGVLATSFVEMGPVTRGAVVTVVAVGLIVTLEAAPVGPGARLLSTRPLVYLGKISYGIYLWHWIVILTIQHYQPLSGRATFAVAFVVATGLAALSYEILEQPIRQSPALDRRRIPVIAAGLACGLLVAVVAVPSILRSVPPTEVAAGAVEGTPVQAADWQGALDDHESWEACPAGRGEACQLTDGSGPRMLLVGDSHAGMFRAMAQEIARRHDADLWVAYLSFCPWPRDIAYALVGVTCLEEQQTLYDTTVPEVDPDLVILVHRSFDDPMDPIKIRDPANHVGDSDELTAQLRRGVDRTVSQLTEAGRKVVMVEPIPVTSQQQDPLKCLSKAEFAEECRFVAAEGPQLEERIFREVDADNPNAWSLDLDRVVCPYLPICDPIINGRVVRRDHNHLTRSFARVEVLDPFDDYLRSNGILP